MQNQEERNGVISFKGYRLFDLQFKCDPKYNQQSIPNGRFLYNFAYGFAELPTGDVQVNMLVKAYFGNEEIDADHSQFSITVEIGGKFATANGVKWDHRWDANAIAILYPYARAIISSVTAQAGVDTVILPTVNVAAMLMNNDAVDPNPE